MKTKRIEVDLGGGRKATTVQNTDGPLCLVAIETGAGKAIKARFDIQKGVFIDPFGGRAPSQNGIKNLVASIAGSGAAGPALSVAKMSSAGRRRASTGTVAKSSKR
jgi:hypothetical protein